MVNDKILKMAKGEIPAELVLKHGRIVDVFNERLIREDIAIADGKIIGIGDYEGVKEIDFEENIIAPGFIDGHLHFESAMVRVDEFAAWIIPRGTTTVFADPHEIANVAGLDGIKYFLDRGTELPWNFNLMLPSCVPATANETSGAVLTADKLEKLKEAEGIFGLGEVMDFVGVIKGDNKIWDKIDMIGDKFIDGHAPGVSGKNLNAYLLGGIMADHECTEPEEALEKVTKGMYVMIREGSVTRDLVSLLPAVNNSNLSRFLFATDDRDPEDLYENGHMNFVIKKAIQNGISPLRAIKLATINSANALDLKNVGAIAPGYKADLVILDNLKDFNVEKVFKDGQLVAENESLIVNLPEIKEGKSEKIFKSVNIGKLKKADFDLPDFKEYRVMSLIKDQIVTGKETIKLENEVKVDDLVANNLVKIAVVERHKKTGNVGLGLLKGFGLRKGAIAISIGHDSHNIIVVGLNSQDMYRAVKEIERLQGGIAVVESGQLIDCLSLEIAGLMSKDSIPEVAKKLRKMKEKVYSMGVTRQSPFMTLSFMALPVIPSLKITDQGLFDIDENKFVSLGVDD
ncbi:MAG TPA: adenine deaminase [Halanaerobiales bacterium]|nr:adenine deaminase [Halanaerobiales bacterium]